MWGGGSCKSVSSVGVVIKKCGAMSSVWVGFENGFVVVCVMALTGVEMCGLASQTKSARKPSQATPKAPTLAPLCRVWVGSLRDFCQLSKLP